MIINLDTPHGQVPITIPEDVAANQQLLDGGHPLYYVIKNPRQTEHYIRKVCELLQDLPKDMKVFELCAGIGLVARANWPKLEPYCWIGVELDEACLPLKLAPGMILQLGDMYEVDIPRYFDLVICEFSNNTLPKMWREPKRAELLRRIADARPKYWYIADVGYYWIHLANHWPIYEKQFGVKPTRENYHELFDKFMRENYGYKVIKWTVGGGAQYFLLEEV